MAEPFLSKASPEKVPVSQSFFRKKLLLKTLKQSASAAGLSREAITTARDVLDILFARRKTKADERLHRTAMDAAPVIWCQFTAWNIHGIIKLVSLFVRTDNPNSPVG